MDLKYCLILLVVVFIANICHAEVKKCCSSGINLIRNHTCADNSSIVILCDFYIVNKNEEGVHINEKDELVENDAAIILSENYCATNFIGEDGDEDIYMVCFEGEDEYRSLKHLIKGALMIISVFFLLVTLCIYKYIPDLRETQDRVTFIGVACLTVFMTLLGIIQFQTSRSFFEICSVLAYVMYFFIISYFAWLNVIMANVWKLTVCRKWIIREFTWYFLNHIYAWTIATILTITFIVYDQKHSTIGQHSCWFSTDEEQEYFVYLPISIMLSINVFLFIWTSISLHLYGEDISADRRKSLRYKCILYLKLFLLSGLLWILEVLSFHIGHKDSWKWFAIDTVNCLHGILIFLVLIIGRKRILRELSDKKLFCITFPGSWAEVEDDEQEPIQEENAKYDLIIK